MKDQLTQLLNRPPRPEAIQTVQQAREFKKFHATATKKLVKKLSETELASLYTETLKWY
jgi:hypothetical protein